MKKNIEIVAYFYDDARGRVSALRFVDGVEIRPLRAYAVDMSFTSTQLPPAFFGPNVLYVAAVVGRNSAGKTTVLQDICRIIGGEQPKTSGYALVVREEGKIRQITNRKINVRLDGKVIPEMGRSRRGDWNVVYYSGGYDPLGRSRALVTESSRASFYDISDQFVCQSDAGDDFTDKLLYLEALAADQNRSLIYESEDELSREIRLTASVGYDPDIAARDLLEFALTSLDSGPHRTRLLKYLQPKESEIALDINFAIESGLVFKENSHFLLLGDLDYFAFLRRYVRRYSKGNITDEPMAFALAIGRMTEIVQEARHRANSGSAREKMSRVLTQFDAVLNEMLGEDFASRIEALVWAASSHNATRIVDGGMAMEFVLSGQNISTNGRWFDGVIADLIKLRQEKYSISFGFSGISEGQRTLLTFYSRLFVRATRSNFKGCTLLVIDEHELGLHPEWQRRYLQELLTFLCSFSSERFQVVLSTHSPFLISDLPGNLVNVVPHFSYNTKPTFAANLLDLLLSPLFLENSTSEFSAAKISAMLDRLREATNKQAVDDAAALLPLIGDELIRNFCTIRVKEKLHQLARHRD